MDIYRTDRIRNVVLLGHGGCRQDYISRGYGIPGRNDKPPWQSRGWKYR